MNFDVRYANHPEDSKRYDTQELRKHYHIANLFEKDSINLTYSHQDRIIAGGIMPVDQDLVLESCKELAVPYFLARRELGAINIGGDGIPLISLSSPRLPQPVGARQRTW
jgi:4-deoxy-L-threo-5-hexosulose-uronate ketol-isomerase